MITTKGIIEDIVFDKESGVTQYRVRIPMFHEIEGSSELSTHELPLAIYPLPPHMEKTTLRIGDVVECTLEDGSLDTVVIVGMIPSSSIRNTAGSAETESGVSIENVQSVAFDIQSGSAILPYKIKILTDDETDNIIDGEGRNYVNGDDIACIKGLNEPLIQTIQSLRETLEYLEANLLHLEVRAEMVEEGDTYIPTGSPSATPTPTPTPEPSDDPMSIPANASDDFAARKAYLFPSGMPQTESEMQQYLATIQVPIWDSSTNSETTTSLTVHKKLVAPIQEAFRAMADIRFPVEKAPSSIGQPGTYAYWWRNMSSGSQSYHSYGMCVDVNYLNPDTITQQVANIWKTRGWFWGGDWSNPYDPVHFSYVNH